MYLASIDPATFWAHLSWSQFSELPEKSRQLAILPLVGFCDHGMGLPLDAEEVVTSELLRRASLQAAEVLKLLVMPPLRLVAGPQPCNFFGCPPEVVHETILAISRCVQAAGISRLVFLNASPWNEQVIDAASRDVRVALGLQTFVIDLSGLGLSLHPSFPQDRQRFQAMGARILGLDPKPSPRAASAIDGDLRPGFWIQPPPVLPDPALQPERLLAEASGHLASLLAEIDARGPIGARHHSKPRTLPPARPAPAPAVYPFAYRSRYLPGMDRETLESLPGKADALVILPTAAIEQHGHHLPVGVDSILNHAWLERVLNLLPKEAAVYCAPTITYGKSNEHVGFPGTVFTSAKLLQNHLTAIVEQLVKLGFRRFVILNTHGGNSSVLVYTQRELMARLGIRICSMPWTAKVDITDQEREYGFHAGEVETALMLVANEPSVDMSRAVCEFPAKLDDPGELRPENAPAIFSWISKDISNSGVMGDATIATRAKGEVWFEKISACLAASLMDLLRRP